MTIVDSEKARFLIDVKDHQMRVIHESGVHRHLRFSAPGTMCMHFDIITWPGYLCYTGDMGTYVFTRVLDMLTFFRGDRPSDPFRHIDRRYWAQKVEAQDKHDGIKEFSEDKWKRAVMDHLIEWIRNHREDTTKEERRSLWEAVIDEVLEIEGDHHGYRQQAATHDFTHKVNDQLRTFHFEDFFEKTLDEYTGRFTWCCLALRWAINVYDASKEAAKAEPETTGATA